jgi:hypothetical protein
MNLIDMNNATAVLDRMKHWTVKSVNRSGKPRRYECTILEAGKRVTGQGRTPVAAVSRALSKLHTESVRAKSAETGTPSRGPSLRIASFAE